MVSSTVGEPCGKGVTPSVGCVAGLLRCGCGVEFKPRLVEGKAASQQFCSRRCKDRAYNRLHPVARQRALPLSPAPQPVVPVRDQRVPKRERRRLGGMSLRIVEMLRAAKGPLSNRVIASAFSDGAAWRTRISDARLWLEQHGETIRCKTERGGLATYWIEANP